MKSRYSAYAVGNHSYIIETTHKNNPNFTSDKKKWKESIVSFTKKTDFLGLKILDFIEKEEEAFVTFKAYLSTGDMIEKSRFLKVDNIWLYESGEINYT